MGRKKWINGLSAVLLAAASLSAAADGSAVARSPGGNQAEETYLVVFRDGLPADYRAIIEQAGGRISMALPELGGVEAVSSETSFLSTLSKEPSVTAANKEMKHPLTGGSTGNGAGTGTGTGTGTSTSMGTDNPESGRRSSATDAQRLSEIDSYWSFQWDMQRLDANSTLYAAATDGKTAKRQAVIGVIDTGIDDGHPDLASSYLGGRNLVPVGAEPGETGDPDDVRDRSGRGTQAAVTIAASGGAGPGLGLLAYRVFPAGGGAATSWIAGAILAAVEDRADVISLSVGGFGVLAPYRLAAGAYSDTADLLLYKRAIRYAVRNNVTVVTASGGEALALNSPADVTAYMNATYGPQGFAFEEAAAELPDQWPDAGVIPMPAPDGWSDKQLAFFSDGVGFSMAGPKAARLAGLLKAAHPEYTPARIQAAIQQTDSATDTPEPAAGQASVPSADRR